MRYNILYKVQEEYYLVCIDVKDIVKVEDILDYIECESIEDKLGLENALNKYIKTCETTEYKPHWFYDKLDAVEVK